MSDAIGEGRRRLLDLLRGGEVDEAERLLEAMEEMYGLLVTMDYPDAITMNLRRATDVSRIADREDPRRPVDLVGAERPARRPRSPRRRAPRRRLLRRLSSVTLPDPGGVAQPGRALPSHGRGQGFESPHLHHGYRQLRRFSLRKRPGCPLPGRGAQIILCTVSRSTYTVTTPGRDVAHRVFRSGPEVVLREHVHHLQSPALGDPRAVPRITTYGCSPSPVCSFAWKESDTRGSRRRFRSFRWSVPKNVAKTTSSPSNPAHARVT